VAAGAGERLRGLVTLLGGEPAAGLGLDLAREEDLAAWLVAACLLAGRVEEGRAAVAFRALCARGLASPASLAAAEPVALAASLAAAGHPAPDRCAPTLVRLGRALAALGGGGAALGRLAAEAEGFEALATRLARLAPGFGPAGVLRFLRPLRDRWPAAREVPLAPEARAAARHLGLLREGEDEEGEPGALRAALARIPGAPAVADVEAALARLGARSCLRERPERCPLGADCPRRV
jgi:hypothetical protein